MKQAKGKIRFLSKIKENSADLTGKQVEIADYIIRHYYKAAFLTAARLASPSRDRERAGFVQRVFQGRAHDGC